MPIQADYTGLEGKIVQNDSKMEIDSQRGYHSRYIRQLCPVCLSDTIMLWMKDMRE